MTGFVYAIAAGELVKIGYSTDPHQRRIQIQSQRGQPCTLLGVVPATLQQERELHRLLAPWRVDGEWYRRCGPIYFLIKSLRPLPSLSALDSPLRQYRTKNSLKLSELARKIGIDKGALSRIEMGKTRPRLDTLQALVAVTGLSVDQIDVRHAMAAQ